MIDTTELRRLAQAALAGPDGISLNWIKLLQDFQQKASPAAISELLDRLEAAEKERDDLRTKIEQMEIGKREISEAHNVAKRRLSALAGENIALRAKIAEMERQEPAGYGVRYVEPTNGEEDWDSIWMHRVFAEDHIKDFTQAYVDIGEPVGAITVVPLYALPGAKGE